MTTELRESLAEILLGLNGLDDYEKIRSLVESAFKGASSGANHFVETGGKEVKPSDLPSLLKLYPSALVMIGVIQHFELNHETESVEVMLKSLLEQLRERGVSETIH